MERGDEISQEKVVINMDKISTLINNIVKIAEAKKSKYRLLLINTNKQNEAIKNNNLDNIIKLIQDKQLLIEQVNKLDDEFIKLFNRIKQESDINDLAELNISKYPNLKRLKLIIEDIVKIGNKINIVENENNKILKQNITNFKRSFSALKKNSKKILAYYGHSNYNKARYIDKKK